MDKVEEIVKNLINKKMTYSEYKEYLENNNLEGPNDIIEYAINLDSKLSQIENEHLDNLQDMNYIEEKMYFDGLIENGVSANYLSEELYKMWDEGVITGFEYRYAIDIIGTKYKRKFLVKAKMYDRYDK